VQDCNFEACTSVQHLPTLASLLLNIILKKSSTAKYVKDLIFVFFSFCHCLLCHLSTQVAAHVYATQQPFVFSKSSNIYSIYHACTCQFSGRGYVTELILRRLDADCNYMYSQSSERDLVWKLCVIVTRVTTNLENLECPGISLNMENSGNSVQSQGKIVTK